ncbi:hypothetical protein HK100_009230 [Physocladia obscura]|uniref:Uncharacterized protein n=1 Tax=Physocladia obscura TaxID=109957 RepID=A0AAD5TF30_9FUNG|nr:hypothetical protein HK100_009230 [Physocladia obscura]
MISLEVSPSPEETVTIVSESLDRRRSTSEFSSHHQFTENVAHEAIEIDSADPTVIQSGSTPPPQYDGVFQLNLLVEIPLDFSKPALEYFNVTLPPRLEGRVANVTFAARMTELNHALATSEMQRNIRFTSKFAIVTGVTSILVSFAVFAMAFVAQNLILLSFLAFSAIINFISPQSAEYTRKAEKLARDWTKEDAKNGINLSWSIKKSFGGIRRSRIDLSVCVFEKVRQTEDDIEALPMYAEQA